jgi:hypothetical protein
VAEEAEEAGVEEGAAAVFLPPAEDWHRKLKTSR